MKKLPEESAAGGGDVVASELRDGDVAASAPRLAGKPALAQAPRRGDLITVTVESLAFEGPGVARVEAGVDTEGKPRRMVVFIDGVAPGDRVEAEIFSLRHGLARARVKRFLQFGPARIKPRCQHFGVKASPEGEPLFWGPDGRPDYSANCGGCSWQFLIYDEQLKVKNDLVRDALQRIGGFEGALLDAVWQPIMGAESPWHYRNKMDFSIVVDRDGKRHVGLHMKGRFNDVTEIRECHLFRPWVGEFLVALRPFLENVEIGAAGDSAAVAADRERAGEHVGRRGGGTDDGQAALKSLIVRAGTNSGEVMVNLLVENADPRLLETGGWPEEFAGQVRDFFENLSKQRPHAVEAVAANHPAHFPTDRLVSIYLTLITNKKGQRTTFEEKLLWGKPTFDEQLHVAGTTLRFEVAPQAFLQPNTRQAERFYTLVTELADLRGGERVLDLFCGTGTIGICLAAARRNDADDPAEARVAGRMAGREVGAAVNEDRTTGLPSGSAKSLVTGLELNAAAVENARQNAALNGIKNIDFLVGDASKLLPELCASPDHMPIELIVVDPPRAGLTTAVIETICNSTARRLIYVSCNPPTLARDLKLLAARGWRLKFVQPVDQFSQTYHVETVTMLERPV